jgi:multidrug efflux pump subunit AcrB
VASREDLVPLNSVVAIAIESGPLQINRSYRIRHVTISADLGGYSLGKALAESKAIPAMKSLPSFVCAAVERWWSACYKRARPVTTTVAMVV